MLLYPLRQFLLGEEGVERRGGGGKAVSLTPLRVSYLATVFLSIEYILIPIARPGGQWVIRVSLYQGYCLCITEYLSILGILILRWYCPCIGVSHIMGDTVCVSVYQVVWIRISLFWIRFESVYHRFEYVLNPYIIRGFMFSVSNCNNDMRHM